MSSWHRGTWSRIFPMFILLIGTLALVLVAACSSDDSSTGSNNPSTSSNTSQGTPRVVQERRSDIGSDDYQIVELTNPAVRGEMAEVIGKVPANATCSLRIRTAIGTTLNTDGVGPATADADGNIRWNYAVGENTIAGTATAFVECPGQTVSRSFRIS